MLRQMPAALLSEWIAFDKIEPVSSGQRAEAGAAIVAAVIANVNRDPKRKREAYQAEEFMPAWGSVKENPKPEDVWSKVKMWAERYKN